MNTTEDEDFTSTRSINIAIEALMGPQDTVWLAPRVRGIAAGNGSMRPDTLTST